MGKETREIIINFEVDHNLFLDCCYRLFPLREQGLNFYAQELTQDEIKVCFLSQTPLFKI